MKEIIIICSAFVFFALAVHINAWNHYASPFEGGSKHTLKLNNTTPYCYHFTWMGGNFNNRTFKNIRNKTCSQYFKDKKTLCINPMVATFEGGEPDIDYILENHATEATCRMALGQVCVKYTVLNHGITSYETRYCTQVNIETEGPMRQGCIQEKRGTETIEVCACRSGPGPKGICNAAFKLSLSPPILLAVILNALYLSHLR